MKTNPNLFDALYSAASNSGVKEILVYSLNYGGKGSHGQGRACDITTITTLNSKNNKVTHNYFRGYNTTTSKWELEEQPEAIQNFETAFKAHSQNENIWGPWYLHYGDSAGIDNVISKSKYDALKGVRTKEEYVKKELANCQGLSVKELAAKSRELADIYDKEGLLDEIEDKLEGVALDPGDSYEKIKLHWEHRNHCHFSVV